MSGVLLCNRAFALMLTWWWQEDIFDAHSNNNTEQHKKRPWALIRGTTRLLVGASLTRSLALLLLTRTAATDGAGWKPADSPAGDGWQADAAGGGDDGWNGGVSEQNISKHANGFDAPADGGCRK